jgi:hypothetical protein
MSDILGYNGIISIRYPTLSKFSILSYPNQISAIRDKVGYIRIIRDKLGYLFGANSQMGWRGRCV